MNFTNSKKPNIANSNKLLGKQMVTQSQLNDILNKTVSSMQVSPEAQRKQTQEDLEQKYLDSQTKLQTAPLELEKNKKNYYVFRNGEAYYDTMMETELKNKAALALIDMRLTMYLCV